MTFVCSIRLCLARFDSWFYTFFNWWDILEFSVGTDILSFIGTDNIGNMAGI